MKSYFKLLVAIIAFAQLSLVTFAQTQTGIVKTKGRLGANGSVISGTRLAGASVKVQGRNAVLSNNSGIFTFPVPGQHYSFVSASKSGYVLTDPDILMRQHTYSGQNPVYVVMETPETQLEDQLASERKIRRNLSQRLAAREQEIEQLKNENKISKQDYHKLMQELYSSQESNEKLIKDMAKRYASMDYDQMDDLNRRVQAYILDGNLIAADSLINSKGDIVTRANNIKREQKLIAAEKQELTERLNIVSQLETGSNLNIEDIAKDCMHKVEIHQINLCRDSIAFYLELRADLDTLNADWQMDAEDFFRYTLADYNRAQFYMNRIKPIAHNTQDKALQYRCFMHLAAYLINNNKHIQAEEYVTKALNISKEIYGNDDLNTVEALSELAYLYELKGNYQSSFEVYVQAMEICQRIGLQHQSDMNNVTPFTSEEIKVFSTLANQTGSLFSTMGLHQMAIHMFRGVEQLLLYYYSEDSAALSWTYTNLGNSYSKVNDNNKALEYKQKVYDIDLKRYGENHPVIAIDRNNLAEELAKTGDYQQAIIYANQAINTFSSLFGEDVPEIGEIYCTLGFIYSNKGEFDTAIKNYTKGEEILTSHYGSTDQILVQLYNDMAKAYEAKGNITVAKEYKAKAEAAKDDFIEYVKSSIDEEQIIKENPFPVKK